MTSIKVEYGKGVLFELGSATNGVLGTNLLGIGEVFVDVSDRVDSLTVRRGRSEQLEPVSAGRATVVLQNRDGLLDPLNTASALYPGVEPARTVRIYGDSVQVFEGTVDDIDLSYTPDGAATVTLTATDGLERFALAEFPTAGTAFAQQDSGARVASVLGVDPSWWTGGTAVASGDSDLAAGTATGNVLAYLNTVARSEAGAFFVGRTGTLTYRNRYYEVGGTALVLADDGSGGAAYETLERRSAAEDLRTVAVAELAGTAISEQSTLGVLRFGVRTMDLGELLLTDAGAVSDRLRLELRRRDRPYPTVAQVVVSQRRQASTAVLGLELGDPVEVVFTPPSVATVTEEGVVGALAHTYSVEAGWRTVVRFEPDPIGDAFVLGTSLLGTGTLGW